MDNLRIWKNVSSVPNGARSQIEAGRMKGKTSIKPQWRLFVLTDQFGPIGDGWYYDTVDRWTEDHGNEVTAHVRIHLYYKTKDGWSKPVEGVGGSKVLAQEKKGPYHSDEAYKMATTDALSVACKGLGIGADVYMDADFDKYGIYRQSAEAGLDEYLDNMDLCETWEDLIATYKEAVSAVADDESRRILAEKKDVCKSKF